MTRSERYVVKPEYTKLTPEGHSIGRKVGAAAAAVTLALTLAACEKSTSNNSSSATEQSTTTTTVPAETAAPTETATPTPTSLPGETVGTSEVLVQQQSIETMDAMSLNDFAKLPLADRAAYAYAKIRSGAPAGPNNKLNPALVVGYWQDLLNEGIWAKDKAVGEKIVSAIEQNAYNTQTSDISGPYKSSVELVDQLSGSNGMNDLYNYLEHGSTLVDPNNGKTYTNVTYDMVTNSGEIMGQATTFQVFEDVVKLSDGRTIKVFTEGKGVLGQASPIPTNPY